MVKAPKIMGVLNATPDSFYDGGYYHQNMAMALKRVRLMVEEGADIIDVGGESTRPQAQRVSVAEEYDRVVPLISAIKKEFAVTVSIDTSKPEIMEAAVAAGAEMINDIRALRLPGALACAARLQVPVCLMHTSAEPDVMQQNCTYTDVVEDVKNFLAERIKACRTAGLTAELMLDPGFGFGKTPAQNLRLLNRLEEFHSLDHPLVVGWSRKSTIGLVLNKPVHQRLYGSLAAAMLAAQKGTHILRVHDVGPTQDVLKFTQAAYQEHI